MTSTARTIAEQANHGCDYCMSDECQHAEASLNKLPRGFLEVAMVLEWACDQCGMTGAAVVLRGDSVPAARAAAQRFGISTGAHECVESLRVRLSHAFVTPYQRRRGRACDGKPTWWLRARAQEGR